MFSTPLPLTKYEITKSSMDIVNARSIPVTTALKSPIVVSRFMIFLDMYSNATQDTTQTAVINRLRKPKRTTDAIRDGTSAIITSSMILGTV